MSHPSNCPSCEEPICGEGWDPKTGKRFFSHVSPTQNICCAWELVLATDGSWSEMLLNCLEGDAMTDTVSAWAINHPGLDPSVSYPGLSNVDELNRMASNLTELATQRDLFKGARPEATFSESERELMTAMADRLREFAQSKLQVMVDCTASGNITQGIY